MGRVAEESTGFSALECPEAKPPELLAARAKGKTGWVFDVEVEAELPALSSRTRTLSSLALDPLRRGFGGIRLLILAGASLEASRGVKEFERT
jgi:hypothetical protein